MNTDMTKRCSVRTILKQMLSPPADNLSEWKKESDLSKYDVICIDEIQFYPDNVEFCEKMANAGKIVEACGLSGNYLREPFPNVSLLISKADDVQFLTAVCMMCKDEGAVLKDCR